MRSAILLTFLILLTAVSPARARLSPHLRWQAATSPHFRVLFAAGDEEWAGRTLAVAEEVHGRLCAELRHTPAEPTTIVLADVSDLPNGMATPFPANLILLYLAPPLEEPFELTDREDWLRRVLVHEYAHILHLDNVEAGPQGVQRVFGRLYFPNAFQPNWLIEGLGTREESRLTAGGRGRSSYTEMVLRMAVLENAFPTLAQAGVAPDRWPGGAVPYLFGVGFYDYLAARHGESFPGDLSEAYAGRAFPFLIDSTARRVIATTYAEEWPAWQETLRTRYDRVREEVAARGLTPLTLLTATGEWNLAPSPSPDGRYLAWNARSADRTPALLLRDLQSGTERELCRLLALSAEAGATWNAADGTLVFSGIERDADDNLYGDLFRATVAGGVTRLSHGLRIGRSDRDPVSGDLLGVTRAPGRTALHLFDASGQERAVLADGRDGRLFFTPRWAPDGARLAVGAREVDGRFTLLLLDRSGRELQRLPRWPGIVASPAWTPDGRFLLFGSDRDGIFNLYAWEPATDATFRVTNLLGGAFSPAPSNDGRQLYLSSYSARGFDLAVMPLAPQSWQPLPAAPELEVPPLTPSPPPLAADSVPYTPWHDLRPRYWLPWFSGDEEGGQAGLTTSGSDPIGRHSYSVTLLYGTASQRPAGALLYRYDGLLPTIQLSASDSAVVHADFYPPHPGSSRDYWERRRSAGLDVIFPSPGLWSRWQLTPGWRVLRFDNLDSNPPFVPPPEGFLSGGRLALGFANAVRPDRAISFEDGRSVEAAAELFRPGVGSNYSFDRQSLDWREYLTLPWGRHQVLAPRLFAGFSQGETLPQRAWQAGGDAPGDLPTSGLDLVTLPLRGYPVNALRGDQALLGSVEYRLPLVEIDDGSENGFVYLRRLHGALFAEGADLYDQGGPRRSRVRTAAGGELRLDAELGYLLPLTLRLVAAKGFDQGGEKQLYFSAWARF